MADLACVIIVEGIDNTQRSLIQGWIKTACEDWWHQLPNVWLAVGQTPGFWRDGVQPFLLPGNSAMVLAVKNTKGNRWAIVGVKDDDDWFENHLPPVGVHP